MDDYLLKMQIKKLNAELAASKQREEVLQNCRAADHITLQSFQKRIVQQQREMTGLKQEIAILKGHLNPVQRA